MLFVTGGIRAGALFSALLSHSLLDMLTGGSLVLKSVVDRYVRHRRR